MRKSFFKPIHINATFDDFVGNNGIGRYIFLPGSDGRARDIAEHFTDMTVKNHPRGHNLYLGTIESQGKKIDVAAIPSGMGCPSTEIIVHELYNLGAIRFLRVGTAGTLQPSMVNVGDLVNVQASVRDEDTSRHYTPIEVPAVASLEFVTSNLLAAKQLGLADEIHTGVVHCKSSLYARELAAGPRAPENQAYLNLMTQSGILATEMETATLFIQTQLYNYQQMQEYTSPEYRVLAGAILSIIGTIDHFEESGRAVTAIDRAIQVALESVRILANQEHI